MDEEEVAKIVVDCGFRLHREIGPGLLESAYEVLLAHLIERRGLRVERQKLIQIEFDGVIVEQGFRADLVVEQRILVELKSVERLSPAHAKQVLTYLRFMKLRIGLLINFGSPTFREGIKRIVNDPA